jgi:hypothetical protein
MSALQVNEILWYCPSQQIQMNAVFTGTQKYHKGVITNLLGERNERSFAWFGRGWELRLDWFMQQAVIGGDKNSITDSFMHVLYRYVTFEANNRGMVHSHANAAHVEMVWLEHPGIVPISIDLFPIVHRSAIEDGAEEIGYEDIEEMNERRRVRLAGEDAACKSDNKTYTGRRSDGDDSGGPGYSGSGYGGWRHGGHDYTVPART